MSLAVPGLALPHGGTFPATPLVPGGPLAPGTPGGRPATPGSIPVTGGADNPPDPTRWQQWWDVNQAPYLALKAHVHAGDVTTGSDGYSLGKGEHPDAGGSLRVSSAVIREVIVPALLAALRDEDSNDIRSSCMIALAKLGDPYDSDGRSALAQEIQRALQKHLVSPSQELSETAAISLGIRGSRDAIGVLTALLQNDVAKLRALGVPQLGEVSVRTRAFAAYGLGLIGQGANGYDRLVINATLRAMLEGPCKTMAHRDIPVACLTAIGLTPLPFDARTRDPSESASSPRSSLSTSRQDQLAFLYAYLTDRNHPSLARAQVPIALARLLGGEEVLAQASTRSFYAEALLRNLSRFAKEDDAMRQSCAIALGVIADSDEDPLDMAIRAALMRVKDDIADPQTRSFALIALAQAAGRPGRGAGDSIHGVQARRREENVRSFLLAELSRGKSAARPWSAIAIAVLERSLDDARAAASPDAKLALRTCLEAAEAPDELGAFAIACGLVRDPAAGEILLAKLDDVRDVEARSLTAIGLGLAADKSAVPALQKLARESKFQGELLRSAATALALLGDKQMVPELIEMLASAKSLSSQASISSALGTIGDARSVDALVTLLRDERSTDLARAFGAVALGIVADKHDLPWNSAIGVNGNYRANPPSLTDGKAGILDIL